MTRIKIKRKKLVAEIWRALQGRHSQWRLAAWPQWPDSHQPRIVTTKLCKAHALMYVKPGSLYSPQFTFITPSSGLLINDTLRAVGRHHRTCIYGRQFRLVYSKCLSLPPHGTKLFVPHWDASITKCVSKWLWLRPKVMRSNVKRRFERSATSGKTMITLPSSNSVLSSQF